MRMNNAAALPGGKWTRLHDGRPWLGGGVDGISLLVIDVYARQLRLRSADWSLICSRRRRRLNRALQACLRGRAAQAHRFAAQAGHSASLWIRLVRGLPVEGVIGARWSVVNASSYCVRFSGEARESA